MDNKEKKNEQDMINTQVEPHNHRAIIGFDKNGVPKVRCRSAVTHTNM